MKPIKELPSFDRPREKLAAKGAKALSDIELLATLLGSGVKGKGVFKISHAILRELDNHKETIDIKTLVSIEGVGFAKACQIVAAFEFARRRLLKESTFVRKAEDILPLISYIADKKQEYFLCISLSGANEVIGNRIVTVGLLNTNQVHPREVFADAISDRAASIILAHNHPSGILTPSADDVATTRQLVDAGNIIGISVLDHIIVTKNGFLSFKEKGLM
ncbi:MAG: DNA repair protein RadC [Pseudomonadota bacterium]|uniref:DNA repair protein RadC n=1 Tax=Candidatus Desulfatibia profunda TaxID=2841695 RepID=A0A8J6NVA2_9BACT|nr:DNA repair protein RadC [Candidatus Desulfatibia profunda]MBL7180263.1 DNA repair protein RadC [Desulfobacterales bacterium]